MKIAIITINQPSLDSAIKLNSFLKDYKVDAVSEGKLSLAKVVVKVQFDDTKPPVIGHGLSIDTMLGSARAYIGALNSYINVRGVIS